MLILNQTMFDQSFDLHKLHTYQHPDFKFRTYMKHVYLRYALTWVDIKPIVLMDRI